MFRFGPSDARAVVALLASVTLVAGALGAPVAAVASHSAGRFIVTVADAYDSRAVAGDYRRRGTDIDFVYTAALNGFAGSMSQADLGELQRDRRVTRIERDGIATASETQSNATWGLDRIDARSGLDKAYTYTATGSGVTAYIIDTGIRSTHTEFTGRLAAGMTTITDGGGTEDCNGHGTHVAGTVGGSVYGVAKDVVLRPVRVLDCGGSGTWSGVIAGMDWVTAHHQTGVPAVANMSLGGGASSSVDQAVQRMIDDGVTTVVAAGNGNQGGKEQDACNYSPARVAAAITIGATTSTDAKTSWSNYGPCLDLFAPGAGITSAWYTGNTATNTISGTSMAAPHAAGVAALYLQGAVAASPQTVRDALYSATTKGMVTSSRTTNNHLLYSPLTVDDGSALHPPPSATFSFACTYLDCSFDGSGSTAVSSYSWDFGDGTPPASGPTATHAYAAGGTYTVTLTVMDASGQSAVDSQAVTVTAPADSGIEPVAGISLEANGYKVKGIQHADLTWGGTTAEDVDVIRDGERVATTPNDGRHTDNINVKGGGSRSYQVCAAGTSTCSLIVTVTF